MDNPINWHAPIIDIKSTIYNPINWNPHNMTCEIWGNNDSRELIYESTEFCFFFPRRGNVAVLFEFGRCVPTCPYSLDDRLPSGYSSLPCGPPVKQDKPLSKLHVDQPWIYVSSDARRRPESLHSRFIVFPFIWRLPGSGSGDVYKVYICAQPGNMYRLTRETFALLIYRRPQTKPSAVVAHTVQRRGFLFPRWSSLPHTQ